MASPGISVSEAIVVKSDAPKLVVQRVVLAMTQDDEYVLVSSVSGFLRFRRSFQPPWGLGMFSKSEECEVAVEQEMMTITLRVKGTILPRTLEALKIAVAGGSIQGAALDQSSRSAPRAVIADIVRSPDREQDSKKEPILHQEPMLATPLHAPDRTEYDPRPVAQPGPILPMPGEPSSYPSELEAQSRGEPTRVYIVLHDREAIPLDRRLVLGRDPSLTPGRDYRAVAVDDGTVSKTHCWIEPGDGGALVCDLYSTNGTAVLDKHGRRVLIAPETPSFVKIGTNIVLGDCTVTIAGPASS